MKHKWYLDERGEVDIFRVDAGHCNGPECMRCGERFCHHCEPPYEDECPSGQLSFFEEDNQ